MKAWGKREKKNFFASIPQAPTWTLKTSRKGSLCLTTEDENKSGVAVESKDVCPRMLVEKYSKEQKKSRIEWTEW